MDDDFWEWWGWYLTDEKIRRDEEAKRKRIDELLSPAPKDDAYEAAKKKWEDHSNIDKFINETEEFLSKSDKK